MHPTQQVVHGCTSHLCVWRAVVAKILTLPVAAAVLLVACGEAVPPSAGPAAEIAAPPLPLKRGFYVSDETDCGAASNATTSVLRRDGYGGARYSCTFVQIRRIDDTRFEVTEECKELFVEHPAVGTEVVLWTLSGDSRYTRRKPDGAVDEARHCEQASLPEPFGDTDISDILQ